MDLLTLSEEIGQRLLANNIMLATAESCTGGWIAQAITEVSGSSQWFDRGFVTYSNEAKQEMLGVSKNTLEQFGAVSEQTVREMAEGAIKHSRAEISVAVSGIAGPTGGSEQKPVGLVYIAWAIKNQPTEVQVEHFNGSRHQIRLQTVEIALQGLLDHLFNLSSDQKSHLE